MQLPSTKRSHLFLLQMAVLQMHKCMQRLHNVHKVYILYIYITSALQNPYTLLRCTQTCQGTNAECMFD